jgi:uncharacterized protein
MNSQRNIITDDDQQIKNLLAATKRIAVLGIKTEAQRFQPAYFVPEFMQNAGFEIIPVPVYYPEAEEILGAKVYRSLNDVPGEIDLVNVFRRSEDVPKHLDEILTKKPKSVWLQSGIQNNLIANRPSRAGQMFNGRVQASFSHVIFAYSLSELPVQFRLSYCWNFRVRGIYKFVTTIGRKRSGGLKFENASIRYAGLLKC